MSNYQGGIITNKAIIPEKPKWLQRIVNEGAFALCDNDLFEENDTKKDKHDNI